jgi:hypothetical protein
VADVRAGIQTKNHPGAKQILRPHIIFVVFTAVTIKNAVFPVLRRVAFVRTDVSEEHSSSFIRVTRIGELGTKLAVKNGVFWDVTPCGVTSQKIPFFIVTAVKT